MTALAGQMVAIAEPTMVDAKLIRPVPHTTPKDLISTTPRGISAFARALGIDDTPINSFRSALHASLSAQHIKLTLKGMRYH